MIKKDKLILIYACIGCLAFTGMKGRLLMSKCVICHFGNLMELVSYQKHPNVSRRQPNVSRMSLAVTRSYFRSCINQFLIANFRKFTSAAEWNRFLMEISRKSVGCLKTHGTSRNLQLPKQLRLTDMTFVTDRHLPMIFRAPGYILLSLHY